ncbi:MAG: rod shape-determining protein, partial [Sphingomonas sp.]|nr:rod shape-determining protein [Sphingomonas sp.]
PVTEPIGSMVVDIGGGTTEVGVISLQGLAFSRSARVGGDRMDEAITAYVRRNFNLLIGEGTAERVKLEIGAARLPPGQDPAVAQVRGREVSRGVPSEIILSQVQIVEALSEPVNRIVEVVRSALECTQPEIAADVLDHGITMTGGGSLLREISAVLQDETGLPVHLADRPLDCVALGAGRTLEEAVFRGALIAARPPGRRPIFAAPGQHSVRAGATFRAACAIPRRAPAPPTGATGGSAPFWRGWARP